jgi:cytochrome c biogenesis protein CcdA
MDLLDNLVIAAIMFAVIAVPVAVGYVTYSAVTSNLDVWTRVLAFVLGVLFFFVFGIIAGVFIGAFIKDMEVDELRRRCGDDIDGHRRR